MEVPSIRWFIKNRLKRGFLEGETSRVWNEILHHNYAAANGYTTGPEMQVDGRIDLFTSHLVLDARAKEYKFLVVECKAPGLETQDAIWEEGFDQLKDYLESISQKRIKPERIFGAIAVGKIVKFYEWNWIFNCIENIAPDDGYFYIDRQCQTVTNRLTFFRDNHL
jgi:hypothetical protein